MIDCRNILIAFGNSRASDSLEQIVRLAGFEAAIHKVFDGDEALDFLRQVEIYEEAPRPDLVLLDLELPEHSGREILRAIRGDLELNELLVVLFLPPNGGAVFVADANDSPKRTAFAMVPATVDEHQASAAVLQSFWRSHLKRAS